MQIFIHILYLVVGFVLLIKGADFFIVSSSSIARKFRISPLIIGLTLVAFGTSLPELAVSFASSLSARSQGLTADIAMGNIIGSNMANLTVILGTSAFIMPIVVKKSINKREFPFLIGSTVLLAVLGFFFQTDQMIVWWEGLILLLVFGFYLYLMITSEKSTTDDHLAFVNMKKATFLLIIGIAGVAVGGFLVTKGAEHIAIEVLTTSFAMSITKATTLVGLSIVALGTSLPELVTSAIAAKRGESDIALGNVIGSNVFNTLFIVGLSSVVVPMGLNKDVLIDMVIVIGVTSITIVLCLLKGRLTRKNGVFLLSIYIIYIVYIILRALGIF